MNFNKWILETKPRVIAKALNIDPSTISMWQQKKTCPRPETMKQLKTLSRGRISYDDIINYHLNA